MAKRVLRFLKIPLWAVFFTTVTAKLSLMAKTYKKYILVTGGFWFFQAMCYKYFCSAIEQVGSAIDGHGVIRQLLLVR